MGVEVLDHRPPEVVDQAVTLVDEDELKGLAGDAVGVDDGERLAGEGLGDGGFESGGLVVALVELFLALEPGVEPLDGSEGDSGGGVDGPRAEVLDAVVRGELVANVGGGELPELVEGLWADVVAVDGKRMRLASAKRARR